MSILYQGTESPSSIGSILHRQQASVFCIGYMQNNLRSKGPLAFVGYLEQCHRCKYIHKSGFTSPEPLN
jgi:hypothetical protein